MRESSPEQAAHLTASREKEERKAEQEIGRRKNELAKTHEQQMNEAKPTKGWVETRPGSEAWVTGMEGTRSQLRQEFNERRDELKKLNAVDVLHEAANQEEQRRQEEKKRQQEETWQKQRQATQETAAAEAQRRNSTFTGKILKFFGRGVTKESVMREMASQENKQKKAG